MYRLLIVDDEEIITDSLYEVFNQAMQEDLDVCKAYSAKEALSWLSSTRIDIVLTDIRMPGMSGIELMEEIHAYWPHCRVIFLTGYSEFDYAYRAIQKSNVRYLLKTEGYGKVIETMQEVIDEINYEHQIDNLIKQSQEQKNELLLVAQSDYFLKKILGYAVELEANNCLKSISQDFEKLNIKLDANKEVLIVLAHLTPQKNLQYYQMNENITSVKSIWNSFMSQQIISAATVDKYGDIVWFLQPSNDCEPRFSEHLITYCEGTLELIQQTCQQSLGLNVSFMMSGKRCTWSQAGIQYDRLRKLQKLNAGDCIPIIQIDHITQDNVAAPQEPFRINAKVEIINAHLEAGRSHDFFSCFTEVETYIFDKNMSVYRSMEVYYTFALLLFSYMNRNNLHKLIEEYNKLMRFDEHRSMRDAFHYLRAVAENIFSYKLIDERDRASVVIEKICTYIHEHLNQDLSLVRLAKLHYFNPSYLSRFFKQECGMKISEYIDECRLKRSKELLCNAELKVRDVALQVGYESAHSFTRFFKKSTGMTPQEYRDKLIENK